VKPFGFLYSLHAGVIAQNQEEILTFELEKVRRPQPTDCKPVAPHHAKVAEAIGHCFDRETCMPVDPGDLKSFRQVIASYHLHPGSKFLNGDYLDRRCNSASSRLRSRS
jgi:hypothetical protein